MFSLVRNQVGVGVQRRRGDAKRAFREYLERGEGTLSTFLESHPEYATADFGETFDFEEGCTYPEVGDLIIEDSHKIVAELGRGAHSRVYLTDNQPHSAIPWVVKLSPLLDRNEAIIQGGLRHHPHIVRVETSLTLKAIGLQAMVMEYVPGVTLDSYIQENGPLDHPTLVAFALQLADALTKAHSQGISHRDVKPQNVLVGDDGHVRLFDFNLATGPTAPIRRGGTIPFLPPEGLRSLMMGAIEEDSHASDVFSLAATLYFAATGEMAWKPDAGGSVDDRCRSVLEQQARGVSPIRAANSDVNPRLATFLEKCIAYAPEARPATDARKFARKLSRELRPLARLNRWQHRNPVKAWAGLAAFALAVLLGYVAYANLPPREERWLAEAQSAVRESNAVKAADYFGRLANRDKNDALAGRGPGTAGPLDVAAHRGHGYSQLKAGNPKGAFESLMAVRMTNDHDPFLAGCIGCAAAASGERGIAIGTYDVLEQSDLLTEPSDLANYGRLLSAPWLIEVHGRDESAYKERGRQMLLRAVAADETLAAAWLSLSEYELKRHERDAAYRPDPMYAKKLAELRPGSSVALYNTIKTDLVLAKQSDDEKERGRHFSSALRSMRTLATIQTSQSGFARALGDSARKLAGFGRYAVEWDAALATKPTIADVQIAVWVNPMDGVALRDVIDVE